MAYTICIQKWTLTIPQTWEKNIHSWKLFRQEKVKKYIQQEIICMELTRLSKKGVSKHNLRRKTKSKLEVYLFYVNWNTSYSILPKVSLSGRDQGVSVVLLWENADYPQKKPTYMTWWPQSLIPHMLMPGIEPESHWWEGSVTTEPAR